MTTYEKLINFKFISIDTNDYEYEPSAFVMCGTDNKTYMTIKSLTDLRNTSRMFNLTSHSESIAQIDHAITELTHHLSIFNRMVEEPEYIPFHM